MREENGMPVKEKLNVVGSGVHSAPFIVHIARLFVITSRHPKRRRPRWLDSNSASLFSLARCRQLGCREQISKLVCKQEERSRQETLRKGIKKKRKERKKEQQQKCFSLRWQHFFLCAFLHCRENFYFFIA